MDAMVLYVYTVCNILPSRVVQYIYLLYPSQYRARHPSAKPDFSAHQLEGTHHRTVQVHSIFINHLGLGYPTTNDVSSVQTYPHEKEEEMFHTTSAGPRKATTTCASYSNYNNHHSSFSCPKITTHISYI